MEMAEPAGNRKRCVWEIVMVEERKSPRARAREGTGGGPRFSFLSMSATDKGHCGGSHCGGLTYAHTRTHSQRMCVRRGCANARSLFLGPPVEYARAYMCIRRSCARAPDHRGIRADPPGDTLHIYTRKRSAVTARDGYSSRR